MSKNIGLMMVLIILTISGGFLAEVVPLFFLKSVNEPIEGLEPLPALELEGRDIYIREGCHVCHTQQIRPFRAETERYGHYSVAGEFVYDRPSFGAPSARVQTSPVSVVVTQMPGNASTCSTRAAWFLNPTCLLSLGCSKTW